MCKPSVKNKCFWDTVTADFLKNICKCKAKTDVAFLGLLIFSPLAFGNKRFGSCNELSYLEDRIFEANIGGCEYLLLKF